MIEGNKMKAQREFVLRVPATNRGKAFIEDLREYLNTDTYKLGRLRFTGKRVTSFGGHTREEDAKNIRVYLKDIRKPVTTNMQELMGEVEHFKHRAEVAEKKLNTLKAYLGSMQAHLQN